MSAELAGAQVLARVTPRRWHQLTRAEQRQLADWLRANGVEPNDVPVDPGVAVVLLDGPAIVRHEVVRSDNGRVQRDPSSADDPYRIRTRVVHSLLRVPLPEHLADPA